MAPKPQLPDTAVCLQKRRSDHRPPPQQASKTYRKFITHFVLSMSAAIGAVGWQGSRDYLISEWPDYFEDPPTMDNPTGYFTHPKFWGSNITIAIFASLASTMVLLMANLLEASLHKDYKVWFPLKKNDIKVWKDGWLNWRPPSILNNTIQTFLLGVIWQPILDADLLADNAILGKAKSPTQPLADIYRSGEGELTGYALIASTIFFMTYWAIGLMLIRTLGQRMPDSISPTQPMSLSIGLAALIAAGELGFMLSTQHCDEYNDRLQNDYANLVPVLIYTFLARFIAGVSFELGRAAEKNRVFAKIGNCCETMQDQLVLFSTSCFTKKQTGISTERLVAGSDTEETAENRSCCGAFGV